MKMMTPSEVEQKIRAGIPDCEVRAVNLNDSNDHFEVTIISENFCGRSVVEQHRMVYSALGDAMNEAIHALVIKTLTPDQYREGLVTEIG